MKGSVRNMNNVQNEMKAVTKEKGGTANGKIVFFHSMRFKLLLFVVIALAAMTVVSFMSLVPGFRKILLSNTENYFKGKDGQQYIQTHIGIGYRMLRVEQADP